MLNRASSLSSEGLTAAKVFNALVAVDAEAENGNVGGFDVHGKRGLLLRLPKQDQALLSSNFQMS